MGFAGRFILTVAVLAIGSGLPAADKPKNRQEEQLEAAQARAAGQQVKQAEENLQQARRRVREAQGKAANAEARHKVAALQVQQLRDELEKKYEASTGALDARQAQRAAKDAFDLASRPVRLALEKQADYQAAVEASEAARQRLRTLADDKTISAGERAALAKDLSQESLRPGQLERAAIEADPKARAAQAKLARATELVAAAVARLEESVAGDPQLSRALEELGKAHQEKEALSRQLNVAERAADEAASRLAREQAQFKALQARQRRDDARDRQRNNDNKNDKKPRNNRQK